MDRVSDERVAALATGALPLWDEPVALARELLALRPREAALRALAARWEKLAREMSRESEAAKWDKERAAFLASHASSIKSCAKDLRAALKEATEGQSLGPAPAAGALAGGEARVPNATQVAQPRVAEWDGERVKATNAPQEVKPATLESAIALYGRETLEECSCGEGAPMCWAVTPAGELWFGCPRCCAHRPEDACRSLRASDKSACRQPALATPPKETP